MTLAEELAGYKLERPRGRLVSFLKPDDEPDPKDATALRKAEKTRRWREQNRERIKSMRQRWNEKRRKGGSVARDVNEHYFGA